MPAFSSAADWLGLGVHWLFSTASTSAHGASGCSADLTRFSGSAAHPRPRGRLAVDRLLRLDGLFNGEFNNDRTTASGSTLDPGGRRTTWYTPRIWNEGWFYRSKAETLAGRDLRSHKLGQENAA
jgi:hypothetical protein